MATNLVPNEHFDFPKREIEQAEADFAKWVEAVENNSSPAIQGVAGGCWLWLTDNTHPFVRCLLESGRVTEGCDTNV